MPPEGRWPTLSELAPTEVLSEYDQPRLFTTTTDDGTPLLVYLYQSTRDIDRFLLVPIDNSLLDQIRHNRLPIRAALLDRGIAWRIDRGTGGKLSDMQRVNPYELQTWLPRPGVRLHPGTPFLELKLSGRAITREAVPLSVIGRTANSASGALKKLARYVVTQTGTSAGRPSNAVRQLYDLSAVAVEMGSFVISLAPPPETDFLRETEKMSQLLEDGLRWLVSEEPTTRPMTEDWQVVVDSLSHLVPPQTGVVEQVEVSGTLAARTSRPFVLTREQSVRVVQERKRFGQDVSVRVFVGFVREFDKDQLSFTLRDNKGDSIAQVVFDEELYDDALRAFDSNALVSAQIEIQKGLPAALKTIQFLTAPFGLSKQDDGSPPVDR